MASVAKMATQGGKARYRILWQDSSGRRRQMRLGAVPKKDAEHIAAKVQALVNSRISGRPWDADLSHWVANLGQALADRLADHELIERRASGTLKAFIDEYIASREDAGANTIRNWRNTQRKLIAFFGAGRGLRTIGKGDADDWRQALVNHGYANATLSKAVKHAKQFLKAAQHKSLCDGNPFLHLKGASERDDSRLVFVPREIITAVLEAAPGAEWRVLIALCRYGGLRCPSEVLRLEWQHINWEKGRLTVPSPKTKRHDKPQRAVPMFPELRPCLEEAFDQAPEGARYVVESYRDATNTNLRTQFERILRRAGVEPWERLFQNLRASRETELANEYPLHVVTKWLGNTPRVASEHYLQVTEEHFQQAIGPAGGGARGGARVAQMVAQKAPVASRNEPQETQETPEKTAISAVLPEVPNAAQYPRQDSNESPKAPGKAANSPEGGAKGGALHALSRRWPELSEETRRKILCLAGIQ